VSPTALLSRLAFWVRETLVRVLIVFLTGIIAVAATYAFHSQNLTTIVLGVTMVSMASWLEFRGVRSRRSTSMAPPKHQ
jgi:hypothetical protein